MLQIYNELLCIVSSTLTQQGKNIDGFTFFNYIFNVLSKFIYLFNGVLIMFGDLGRIVAESCYISLFT